MARSVIPSLADRLRTAQEARQARLQRAKVAAESPEAAQRWKTRQAIVTACEVRIASRKAEEQARKDREVAERAAAEAELQLYCKPNSMPVPWRKLSGRVGRPLQRPSAKRFSRRAGRVAEPRSGAASKV
jgi:hypothetical protein